MIDLFLKLNNELFLPWEKENKTRNPTENQEILSWVYTSTMREDSMRSRVNCRRLIICCCWNWQPIFSIVLDFDGPLVGFWLRGRFDCGVTLTPQALSGWHLQALPGTSCLLLNPEVQRGIVCPKRAFRCFAWCPKSHRNRRFRTTTRHLSDFCETIGAFVTFPYSKFCNLDCLHVTFCV